MADAFVTEEMMQDGVRPFLKENDVLKVLFFGSSNRREMRDTVKAIEAFKRDELAVPAELETEIVDCDLLIVHLCPVTKRLLNLAEKLKAILSCRGGNENIDVSAATAKKIIVTSYAAHNANAVAEYTVGLIICESRNIARANFALKNGEWREKFPNTETQIKELKDLKIGIIGFGSVGRLVAEKMKALGSEILISTPHISENAYDLLNFNFVDLDTLLEESDVISLHARADKVIIGEREFSLMKPTAYFINTARSILVDSSALENVLRGNKILGAAIDVFESEPNIATFYRDLDNVTVTNHRGGDTINSYKDAPNFAINNYISYLAGYSLKFWVNKKELFNK